MPRHCCWSVLTGATAYFWAPRQWSLAFPSTWFLLYTPASVSFYDSSCSCNNSAFSHTFLWASFRNKSIKSKWDWPEGQSCYVATPGAESRTSVSHLSASHCVTHRALWQQQDINLWPGNTCFSFQAESVSKDLYIEVYPGTYSVTVGADDLTKKTHVVAVDSGQSVDLVFPIWCRPSQASHHLFLSIKKNKATVYS